MITKTYTLTALALVTALPLFAQHQVSLQAGIGMYSTPDTYVYDAVSESGSVFLTGNSNLADFVADPASTLAYQYRLSPRFRLAAQASYLRFKGIDGKEAFSSRSVNGGPPTIVSLASPRSLRALRLDGLVWYNVLSQKKTALLFGAGFSYVHRSQNFRSNYQLDFDDQNQAKFLMETYTDEAKDSYGLPVALQLGIPIVSNWQLIVTASGAFYRNSDAFLLFTAGAAYQW